MKFPISQKTAEIKFLLFLLGVTRFELAASTSLRWRSSQTEPHPDKAFICLPRLNASVIIHKAGVVVNNFF